MTVSPNSVVTAQGLRTKSVITTAAKTTYNDAANAVKLLDAGTNGSILYSCNSMPRATVTATQMQLYRSPDNGTTLYLIATALMAAATVDATHYVPPTSFGYGETSGLRLAAGDSLWVGQGVAWAGGIVTDATVEDL